MTKLILSGKKTNPLFLEEAGEYLEAHGFRRADSIVRPGETVYFLKDDLAIEITHDLIELKQYNPPHDDRTAHWALLHSFTGISQLDLFGFMMLFHITGAATIKNLFKGAIKEGVHISADEMIDSLFSRFRKQENNNVVPVNY